MSDLSSDAVAKCAPRAPIQQTSFSPPSCSCAWHVENSREKDGGYYLSRENELFSLVSPYPHRLISRRAQQQRTARRLEFDTRNGSVVAFKRTQQLEMRWVYRREVSLSGVGHLQITPTVLRTHRVTSEKGLKRRCDGLRLCLHNKSTSSSLSRDSTASYCYRLTRVTQVPGDLMTRRHRP